MTEYWLGYMAKKEFSYKAGVLVEDVFLNLGISPEDGTRIAKELYEEGYTKRAICYTATVAEEKLARFIGDPRLEGILKNEVRKRAIKRGDPRWNDKR